ncbi:hypothetical protein SELMODRAFT_430624 [Selaginella moellendorffii]|uniref:Uncharacterized protein n=1 Tax=Selaginella moellendorffii TaxID=88036 RepID=D8T9Z8_SELML|nr:hypothetical protein SELMODRAFT_430624 [Selaginella moellendorffii]
MAIASDESFNKKCKLDFLALTSSIECQEDGRNDHALEIGPDDAALVSCIQDAFAESKRGESKKDVAAAAKESDWSCNTNLVLEPVSMRLTPNHLVEPGLAYLAVLGVDSTSCLTYPLLLE